MPDIQEVLPKYLQIANYIRDQILGGQLRPGDEIPSERQLSMDWRVSRPTATKALDALRAGGLVISRQGSGTYVLDQGPLNRRARERYQKAWQTGRIYAAGEHAEIVDAGAAKAPSWVAAVLGLDPESEAIHRRRVIRNDSRPVEISSAWYSPSLAMSAPRLLDRQHVREGTIAYLEETTGRRAHHARDQVSARLAAEDETSTLDLDSPAAVLVVRHVVYDASERPLEATEAVYSPGRWAFEEDYTLLHR